MHEETVEKTEKLYYQDSFLKEFTAQVLSCEEAQKDTWRVTLNRTAFYPEGGGQPADHGVLGFAAVTDVHEKDGIIYHTCDQALKIGQTVTGRINWTRRFDHMQQHSGEHILSGILCDTFQCDNVGFHLGAETVTIDYNAPISWRQALTAERRANEIIWADRAVEVSWPPKEELVALHYRSKRAIDGEVRIVTFPEADRCACCGTHVSRAGQVGLVKILSCQKFRSGARLEIVCGRRAFDYLSVIYEQDRNISQTLSVKPQMTSFAVNRLQSELSTLKERVAALEESAFAAIAAEHAGQGNVLLIQEPMRADSVRRLADAVARQCGGTAAVFAGQDGKGYFYAIVHADVETVSVKELNNALHGRGGGRDGFAQGNVQATEQEIRDWFQEHEL